MAPGLYYVFRGEEQVPVNGIAEIVDDTKTSFKVQYVHPVRYSNPARIPGAVVRSASQKFLETVEKNKVCPISSFTLHRGLFRIAEAGDEDCRASYRKCLKKSVERKRGEQSQPGVASGGRACGTPTECTARFLKWLGPDFDLLKTLIEVPPKVSESQDDVPRDPSHSKEDYQREAWIRVIKRGYATVHYGADHVPPLRPVYKIDQIGVDESILNYDVFDSPKKVKQSGEEPADSAAGVACISSPDPPAQQSGKTRLALPEVVSPKRAGITHSLPKQSSTESTDSVGAEQIGDLTISSEDDSENLARSEDGRKYKRSANNTGNFDTPGINRKKPKK